MRTHRNLLATLLMIAPLFGMSASKLQARYARPDIEAVPVDRLVENLEQLAAKDPKDAQVRINLARIHAMAYALKSDTAEIRRGKPEDGAWFGFEPKNVPFVAKPSSDEAKMKAAKEHLSKAIEFFQQAIKLAPDNLAAQIGYAWCADQAGDKDKAIAAYRETIEKAWQQEKDMTRAPLGWHAVTAEAAGYLTPLLDTTKDKDEIATLRERSARLARLPRPVTPIAIPLRDGLTAADLIDASARVPFDADGSGIKKHWSWIQPNAGWLVYDPQGTGQITSALQMFGGVSFWLFWENGYQALGALDDNRDGKLSGQELTGLAIWQDLNSNGTTEQGEVRSLAAWNIVEISCRYLPGDGVTQAAHAESGVTFADGTTRATFDIILHPR